MLGITTAVKGWQPFRDRLHSLSSLKIHAKVPPLLHRALTEEQRQPTVQGPLSSWSPSYPLCPHSTDLRAAHEAIPKLLPFTTCHLKMYLHKFENEVEILILPGVLTFTMPFLESEPRDVP